MPAPRGPDDLSRAGAVTLLVPMYNEEERLPHSFERWRAAGLLDRFPLVLVDDGSSDRTAGIAEDLCRGRPGCRVVQARSHRSKPAALQLGLREVATPWVLCLDADTWFAGTAASLEDELATLMASGIEVAAFRLEPCGRAGSLVVELQVAEYVLINDAVRRLFQIVGNVNGSVALWQSATLRQVLARHSLVFEGDDLEATFLAHRQGARVAASPALFRKLAKPTWRALVRQRLAIWEPGLFRTVCQVSPFRLGRGAEPLFFQWYVLFEVLLHPAKVAGLLSLSGASWVSPGGGPLVAAVYGLGLAAALLLWVYHRARLAHPVRLLAVLGFLAVVPAVPLAVLAPLPALLASLVLWSGVAGLLALAIGERRLRRRAARMAPLVPLYFLFLSIAVRTAGLIRWATAALRVRIPMSRAAPSG